MTVYCRLNASVQEIKPLRKIINNLDRFNQVKGVAQSILSLLNNETGIQTFSIPGTGYGIHIPRMFKIVDVKVEQ